MSEANQLSEILEEIRQIEESEGFEGPKISSNIGMVSILLKRANQPDAFEDLLSNAVQRNLDDIYGLLSDLYGLESHRDPSFRQHLRDHRQANIPHWLEDIVVGEIGRACDAQGWRFDLVTHRTTHPKHVSVIGPGPFWSGRSKESRTIAAAKAYREAIKIMTE